MTDLHESGSCPSRSSCPVQLVFSKKDALALTVLGLFCLYLFRDIVLSGHLLIGDDFVSFYLGMKKFLVEEVRLHREIPYWNPYLFGGMPFWAHFESTIFYPLGFLFYLLSPEKAFGYTMFLHLLLAGLFMYLLARSMGIGEFGSFVAAAVFTCNGFVMAILFLGHMSPVESYVWLPIVIYALHRAMRSPAPWKGAMVAGVLWGIQILAGAPQDAFYTFVASMLFLLGTVGRGHSLKLSVRRLLGAAATMFFVGAGLSCIQIIPAFELIQESVRAALDSYEWSTLASYPLQGILTVLLPHFFGYYAEGSVWVSNTPWSIPQQNLYTGILTVVLLGFASVQEKIEKRTLIFGVLLALMSLILAFGHNTPVYKMIYLLPGFDRFRAPSKIMVLWVFSMAILAGIGMDGLLAYIRKGAGRGLYPLFLFVLLLIGLVVLFRYHPPFLFKIFSPFFLTDTITEKLAEAQKIIFAEVQRLCLFSSLILLALLLLKKKILPVWAGASALCALLLVDLGLVHEKAIRHDDALYAAIEGIKQRLDAGLGKDKSLFRVGSFRYSLGANLEMVLGYQTVGGYTALFPSRYYDYMTRYSDDQLPKGWVSLFYGVTPHHVFMDLLNVKFHISHSERVIGIRDTCLPRAFLVPGSLLLAREQILDFLASEKFNPQESILFEKEDLGTQAPLFSRDPLPASGPVEITHYRPDRIALTADSPDAAYLFLSEIFYPGWEASIDGQPARILRGNYLFRVLELPKGRHSIVLEFAPWTIRLGTGVTIVVIFALGAFALFEMLKRPRSSPSNP
jgi:hypothetical protein